MSTRWPFVLLLLSLFTFSGSGDQSAFPCEWNLHVGSRSAAGRHTTTATTSVIIRGCTKCWSRLWIRNFPPIFSVPPPRSRVLLGPTPGTVDRLTGADGPDWTLLCCVVLCCWGLKIKCRPQWMIPTCLTSGSILHSHREEAWNEHSQLFGGCKGLFFCFCFR